MKKLMLAMFVGVFSLSALACDGSSKGKEKEKPAEENRIEFAQ